MNSNCSNLLDMRNLQEQVKKAFCYQKLFWPFTVWINCSSDLKFFANSRPSASNFKSFSQSLEQFLLTVGQNNFGNKIPLFMLSVLLNWFMGHALFWSHALYKPKWQVAKSLLSYHIPTYIVMMAQLIIKKQFTIVFELLKRRRSKL